MTDTIESTGQAGGDTPAGGAPKKRSGGLNSMLIADLKAMAGGLGISGAFRYLPLVAGGVLIVLFSVERIVLRWAGVDVDTDLHEREDEIPDVADVREV